MSKGPLVIFGLVAAICLVALPFYAFQKEGTEDAAPVTVAAGDEDDKRLFATNCGACHTLEAAGTDGVVGPNLDEIITQGPAEAPRVLSAVENGLGGRMPADILRGTDAERVAEFVGEYARD